MERDEEPEIGYDHATIDVEPVDEGLREIDAVVYVHEGSGVAELAGLEYDGSIIPAETAVKLYKAAQASVYDDRIAENGMDAGVYSWSGVKEVLE